ncbi:MAG: tetratricopeptide repeat protein [Brachymonas sp.]|nr:tetratricopeptide repeat protein [Brachymonas sp.]
MLSIPYLISIAAYAIPAIFFAIHAVQRGRELYWLLILFMFPLFGSVVYFFAVYLPESRIQRSVGKVASAAMQTLDPGKALREARKAYELTPTAQNRMQLAKALLDDDQPAEAAEHYEACLKGPFANDPEIRLGAARARLANGQNEAALDLLLHICEQDPHFRPETVAIALAKTYGALGQDVRARQEFDAAVQRFGSFEAHAEYAIWAAEHGHLDAAQAQHAELQAIQQHWKGNRHAKMLNKALLKRLDAALSKAGIQ